MSTPADPIALAYLDDLIGHTQLTAEIAITIPSSLHRRVTEVVIAQAGNGHGKDATFAYLLGLGLDAYERQRAERDEVTP